VRRLRARAARTRGARTPPHTPSPRRPSAGYVARNPTQGYVQAVSLPKLRKVRDAFPELLK